MQGQKSQLPNLAGGGWFSWELKFLGLFLAFISFSNLIFSKNTFALYTPTLSASVDNSAISVNGNQVINSASQTSELPIRVTVNTNNKTGYTATLNTETDETALVNVGSVSGVKINSIDTNKSLTNFSENSWGFLGPLNGNYQPIPGLSNSVNLFGTAAKTSGNESFDFKIGMKLSSNLESGSYTNKLVVSIISNQYEKRALMTTGINFNTKLKTFETGGNKIEHIMRSATASSFGVNTVSLEDEANSDYEIKAWYDSVTKTAYYYTEAEKIFLNDDSNAMFYNLVNLTSLDVSSFDTSKVRGMGNMFFGDEKLVSLDLSNFNTQSLTNMDKMFYGMSNLTNLNISSFNTSNAVDMGFMFSGAKKIVGLNLSHFDTLKVTNMNGMFENMEGLTELNISSFNTKNVEYMSSMFKGLKSLQNLDLSHFRTEKVTRMDSMFNGSNKIASLDLSSFNTEKVTYMSEMFRDMTNLVNLNISSFDTRNVTSMSRMFSYLSKLATLDLSNFNTSKVTDMSSMFSNMNSLTNLNIGSFDTSNVTNMREMFYYVNKLTSLDLSHFNTAKVTGSGMIAMFSGMNELKSLNVTSFDTSKITNMYNMFFGTYSLTELDLSSFDTSSAQSVSSMFRIYTSDMDKDKLERIYVNNDFNVSKITEYSSIFGGRKKLRGGNGSFLADPSTADLSWLRVDRPGVQGYFTRKP